MNYPIPSDMSRNTLFKEGDVFVLFGELFGRGYATGLVDEARKAGMKIVGITVGRREEDNALRALTAQELAEAEERLDGTIINEPLMAGFDLDAPVGEPTPTDLLNKMTVESWKDDTLDWTHIEMCRKHGVDRFKTTLGRVMRELDGMIPDGKNVLFAHTMAGGIPKAKAFLVIANRIYKGRGARHMSSQALIESDLGKLILQNFDEVSANTFQHLLDASAPIRERIEASGGQVRYTAYGYHGTEILIDGDYQWQTYTSYTQGYAKMRLERVAESAWATGIKATVYNCPEIRTNSSDIFVGVELSLFPLLQALKRENGGAWAESQWQACRALLQEGSTLEGLLQKINDYNASEVMKGFRNFEAWPMDNTRDLADLMIGTSDEIIQMHKDRKALVTDLLSALVLDGTGQLMFYETSDPAAPVIWLNHDIIAKQLIERHCEQRHSGEQ